MDLANTHIPKSGRLRKVFPFDLPELGKWRDPNFWIQVKEENLNDVARRWDANKYRPGGDKETQQKAIKVGLQSIIETIDSWGREPEDGKPALTNNGVVVECDKAGKALFAEAQIPIGDEWKTLWGLTVEALDAQKREELGNETSSSPSTSAAV